MAVTSIGKGFVFAVGDPWLYNEYVDGRKLPADFQNYLAAEELVKWALSSALKSKGLANHATIKNTGRAEIAKASTYAVIQTSNPVKKNDGQTAGQDPKDINNDPKYINENPKNINKDPGNIDQDPKNIIVSPDGKGDYRSIQAAINSLPDSSAVARTIH